MANTRTCANHRNCGRCGQPVRHDSNLLRAQFYGVCVWFHWACFIALMRENKSDPNATAVAHG